MKYREIGEKVRSGEMTLDVCGHQVNDDFLRHYDREVAGARGDLDGKWNLDPNDNRIDVDGRMRAHFERNLEWDIDENEYLWPCNSDNYCFGCGERLGWVLNGDKMVLRWHWDGKDWQNHPEGYRCPFETPQPTRGSIKVASPLIFANFFRHVEDQDKVDQYTERWSLNNLKGRTNITAYKAERNVAYGQMGNGGLGVFVHPNNRSIIIGNQYVFDHHCDGMTDEQYEIACKDESLKEIEGHKQVGDGIIMDVWRWEATDRNSLTDEEYKNLVEENGNRGLVEVNVEHGVWDFEHYYDTETSPNPDIYARLTLKADNE